MAPQRFVIEGIYPLTGCIRAQSLFEAESSTIQAVLGVEHESFTSGWSFSLDSTQLSGLLALFKISTVFDELHASIRKANRFDSLPYLIHTNRELDLMLGESKPLSVFSASYQNEDALNTLPEIYFEPYVLSGRLIKCEYSLINAPTLYLESDKKRVVRYLLYTLPREQWRIEAYYWMQKTSIKCGWGEIFERMEGALLGYEEWQTDTFIETVYKRRSLG